MLLRDVGYFVMLGTSVLTTSIGRYRRLGAVSRKGSEHKPESAICYGIASVFTPPRYRGAGYAKHMMRLLHWVIAREDLLPAEFPAVWGSPPKRIEGAGEGLFSALWSDIGREFYGLCGIAPGNEEGWKVREGLSTIWDVEKNAGPGNEAAKWKWTWLGMGQVEDLWMEESARMALEIEQLTKSEVGNLSVAFLPGGGVESFQRLKLLPYLKDWVPPVESWGIISIGKEESAYATWTFEHKALLITRLRASGEQLEEMLGRIKEIARKHGMEKVEIWNLARDLRQAAARLGATEVVREEHLPALCYYGKKDIEDVNWLYNER